MVALGNDVWGMSEAALEAFALGVVRLDRRGIIEFCNQAEVRFLNRPAAGTIGLHYFRDVTPFTEVKSFEPRFDEFICMPGPRIETIGLFYPFSWSHKQVLLTLTKGWLVNASSYVLTQVSNVSE